MQAALQPYVDAAISKTVNLPAGYSFEGVLGLFERAYAAGLKGLTVFPANSPWAKFCWPTAAPPATGLRANEDAGELLLPLALLGLLGLLALRLGWLLLIGLGSSLLAFVHRFLRRL